MKTVKDGKKTTYYCGKKQSDKPVVMPVVKNKKIKKNEVDVSASRPEEVNDG